MPAVPQRREDIPVLPNNYQLKNRGDCFLLFDSGVEDVKRLIIFATNDAIDYLQQTCTGLWTVYSKFARKYFSKFILFTY